MQLEPRFELGNCVVDPSTNSISGPGGTATVQPRIMRILLRLAEAPAELVPREELLESGWQEAPYVADEALTKAVSLLRKALSESSGEEGAIRTIPKAGYLLTVIPERHSPERHRTERSPGIDYNPIPREGHRLNRQTRPVRSGIRVPKREAAVLLLLVSAFFLGGIFSGSLNPGDTSQPLAIELREGDWEQLPQLMAALSDDLSILSDSTWVDAEDPSKTRRRISMAAASASD